MKTLICSLLFIICLPYTGWKTDFTEAQKEAKESHKKILLYFSGSDWCAPCMRTRKEIFESESFTQYADKNLVLVNADFPRSKKHKISKEQLKHNESLAEKYNPQGIFPYTIVLTEDGKPIKSWSGFPNLKPEEFINQINLCK